MLSALNRLICPDTKKGGEYHRDEQRHPGPSKTAAGCIYFPRMLPFI